MMGTLITESLVGILLIIIVVTLFYNALSVVKERTADSVHNAAMYDKASSTSLLVSVYSYSLQHGYFDPRLECSVGANISCRDEGGHTVVVNVYKRKGGGD